MLRDKSRQEAPGRWLLFALLYAVGMAVLGMALSLQAPWLGLALEADAQADTLRVATARGPAAAVPVGAVLLRVSSASASGGEPVTLQAQDLLEEPDVVANYVQMDDFFARQGKIARHLAQPEVMLTLDRGGGRVDEIAVRPGDRPLSALPALFWFQVVISVLACLIASWVWVLRPADWGARMFGLTGLLFPLFAIPAAVYSSRELALPADWFFALSAMNHWSAYMWGAALGCIFLTHPRPLVQPRLLVWPFVVFSLWWVADVTRTAPDLDWGNRFLVMTEMLLAIGFAAVQWVRSRAEPVDRAALRWFIVSMLLGSSLFILTAIATLSLGWLPPLPQGYAFGFFLLIYIGIALGMRRYRLFELGAWAYRLLMWVGGALAVVVVDALLIAAVDWSAGTALGVSLWVCGLLYFPVRQWAWHQLVQPRTMQLHELLPDLVRIAFEPLPSAREALWDGLLRRLYAPLEIRTLPSSAGRESAPGAALEGYSATHRAVMDESGAPVIHDIATITEDGLTLLVPGGPGHAARQLRYPQAGRRLFSPEDARFMTTVGELMRQAEAGRDAHEQGALQERRRIARDMHDDVGARLLMLIHRAPTRDLAEVARAAMTDLRTALSALDAQPVALAEAMADWRAEATSRCEAAGVALNWQAPAVEPRGELSARYKSLVERALRESLTNALKHAQPSRVWVGFDVESTGLELHVCNDGRLADPATWKEGLGLGGMRQRLAELGGELQASTSRGPVGEPLTQISIRLPLEMGAWA